MTAATLILEFLKVLLTGPVVAGAVALAFMLMFRQPLRGLITRIASIKLPGGGELVAPQLPPEPVPAKPPEISVSQAEPPLLPASLSDTQVAQIREVLDAERARAYLWEYRYLNLFLVARTIRVLEWFVTLPNRPTIGMYDALWTSTIPEAAQRTTILSVLESHHLIQRDGDLVGITPKGREYLEWKDKL